MLIRVTFEKQILKGKRIIMEKSSVLPFSL